jgi:hypothetical protein
MFMLLLLMALLTMDSLRLWIRTAQPTQEATISCSPLHPLPVRVIPRYLNKANPNPRPCQLPENASFPDGSVP